MYIFPSQFVVTLYLSSSAAFRCNACSFTKYFTPKSSTNKVKLIGRLSCSPCGAYYSLLFGRLCITIFVPGGDKGVGLQSNPPNMFV